MKTNPGRRTLLLSSLIAFATLGSCASGVYRAPEAAGLPKSSVAVVEIDRPTVVSVTAINGTSRGWGLFDFYELAPGQARITVSLVEGGTTRSSNPMYLDFRAEAGTTYVLRGSSQSTGPTTGRWNAWIVEKSSGKTVSSPAAK